MWYLSAAWCFFSWRPCRSTGYLGMLSTWIGVKTGLNFSPLSTCTNRFLPNTEDCASPPSLWYWWWWCKANTLIWDWWIFYAEKKEQACWLAEPKPSQSRRQAHLSLVKLTLTSCSSTISQKQQQHRSLCCCFSPWHLWQWNLPAEEALSLLVWWPFFWATQIKASKSTFFTFTLFCGGQVYALLFIQTNFLVAITSG